MKFKMQFNILLTRVSSSFRFIYFFFLSLSTFSSFPSLCLLSSIKPCKIIYAMLGVACGCCWTVCFGNINRHSICAPSHHTHTLHAMFARLNIYMCNKIKLHRLHHHQIWSNEILWYANSLTLKPIIWKYFMCYVKNSCCHWRDISAGTKLFAYSIKLRWVEEVLKRFSCNIKQHFVTLPHLN